jgi:hypothetical protein
VSESTGGAANASVVSEALIPMIEAMMSFFMSVPVAGE